MNQGSQGRRFGWSIWRDEHELTRSTEEFSTLTEALMAAARARPPSSSIRDTKRNKVRCHKTSRQRRSLRSRVMSKCIFPRRTPPEMRSRGTRYCGFSQRRKREWVSAVSTWRTVGNDWRTVRNAFSANAKPSWHCGPAEFGARRNSYSKRLRRPCC
jgi:hypothetical protein